MLQCQLVGAVNPIGKLLVGSNNRGQRVTPPVWYPHPIVLTVEHKGHHPRQVAAHLGVFENMQTITPFADMGLGHLPRQKGITGSRNPYLVPPG